MEEKGLEVAGFRKRRICVSAQRKPEKKAAVMMRINPITLKSISPNTIIITPTVMVKMMRTSRMEGVSRRKTKAKRRTKPSAEDLHMATCGQHRVFEGGLWNVGHTVKCQAYELQRHIAQPNIQARSHSTWAYSRQVVESRHEWLLRVQAMLFCI